jgi:hypothetical protein
VKIVRIPSSLGVVSSNSGPDTVLSFHEYPGSFTDPNDLKAMRRNTLSVLQQLSAVGYDQTDPLSLQTVRHALTETTQAQAGIEGSSLLFYYLFEDWRAVYSTVGRFHQRLGSLV